MKVKLKTQSKATEKVQFLGTSKIFTETSDQVKRGQYELSLAVLPIRQSSSLFKRTYVQSNFSGDK